MLVSSEIVIYNPHRVEEHPVEWLVNPVISTDAVHKGGTDIVMCDKESVGHYNHLGHVAIHYNALKEQWYVSPPKEAVIRSAVYVAESTTSKITVSTNHLPTAIRACIQHGLKLYVKELENDE